MVPQTLISGTISGATTAVFEVRRAPALLFVQGLAGVEAVAVNLVGSSAFALSTGGNAWELDVDDNNRTLDAPGQYEVSISSSAGAILVGLYEAT